MKEKEDGKMNVALGKRDKVNREGESHSCQSTRLVADSLPATCYPLVRTVSEQGRKSGGHAGARDKLAYHMIWDDSPTYRNGV